MKMPAVNGKPPVTGEIIMNAIAASHALIIEHAAADRKTTHDEIFEIQGKLFDDMRGLHEKFAVLSQKLDDILLEVVSPPASAPALEADAEPSDGLDECPKCGGEIWDNRAAKHSGDLPKNRPDRKCKDAECGWVEWAERKGK